VTARETFLAIVGKLYPERRKELDGIYMIERPFRDLDNPDPEWSAPMIEQDQPNALLKAYSNLRIMHYQDTMEVGDWQQTSVNRL
jgi:hypothetical protein